MKEGEQVVVAANFLIDAESNLKAAIGGLAAAAPAAAGGAGGSGGGRRNVGHKGQGTVDSVDAKAGTVSLNHGAIASLKWPAMTMEFKAANPALLKDAEAGRARLVRVRGARARRMGDHRSTRAPASDRTAAMLNRIIQWSGAQPLPGPARHAVHRRSPASSR